jgi:response regulator of citrate/malate metabolism
MSYVLIVEDDKVIAESLAVMIRQVQLGGALRAQRAECRAAAHKDLPALILLDVHMPNMDGMDMLTHVKHNASTRDTAVVFVTADDSAETFQRAQVGGAMAYLIKPVSMEQIEGILNQIPR